MHGQFVVTMQELSEEPGREKIMKNEHQWLAAVAFSPVHLCMHQCGLLFISFLLSCG
jgi:hypothetical protein